MKRTKVNKTLDLMRAFMVAAAGVTLTGAAHADGHLKFPIGEGEFSWNTYHDFAMEPTTILVSNSQSPQAFARSRNWG